MADPQSKSYKGKLIEGLAVGPIRKEDLMLEFEEFDFHFVLSLHEMLRPFIDKDITIEIREVPDGQHS